MSKRKCSERASFSVEQALARHRLGDRAALADLMRECGPAMTAVARRYVSTHHDAEDAVQDAWVSFVRAQHTIVHQERVAGWLCVTAARAALAIATRQSRCEPVADERIERASCAWVDELDSIDDPRRRHMVRRAISRLSQRDQELISMLVDDEDLAYATISARTGCAIGSIGPTRRRIITKLRRDPSIRELGAESAA
jgi:RNA polymerase sigma factor (sigma-70 family)